MDGWIKLYRQMINWEWYQDNNVKVLFIHLLILANHHDQKWQGKVVNKGQLITSYSHLAKELKLSVQQIRTSLDKLKLTHEITVRTTNKYTLVSIENYEKYQSEGIKSTNKVTDKLTINQQTTNKQITTNKNDKNVNNNNNLIVDKFNKPTIDDLEKYCNEKKYKIDCEYFFNYYESNGWKVGKNKMKSWKATLSTWNCRKDVENQKLKLNGNKNYINYSQRKYENFDDLYANIKMENKL